MTDKIKQCEALLPFEVNYKSRKRHQVEIRGVLFKLIKDINPNISIVKIGSYFGKDHATVLHALKNFEIWSNHNKELLNYYNKFYPIFSNGFIAKELLIMKKGEVIESFQGLKRLKVNYQKNKVIIEI